MFKRNRPPHPHQHTFIVGVDRNLCYYCSACVAVCPPDSIFLENAHLSIDHETCTRCERCIAMCPVHALHKAPAATVNGDDPGESPHA